jgi:hypothetical protein
MYPHSDFDCCGGPWFCKDMPLSIQSCLKGIICLMKRCTKRIPNNLKDKPVVILNRLIQDFIVTRHEGRHGVWVFLGKFGAAFDIGK